MNEEIEPEVPYTKNSKKNELEYALIDLGIPVNTEEATEDWVITTRLDSCVKLGNRTIAENLMPNVKGMGIKDALFILENVGLSVEFQGRGTVLDQSVTPGARISKGEVIVLEMSVK